MVRKKRGRRRFGFSSFLLSSNQSVGADVSRAAEQEEDCNEQVKECHLLFCERIRTVDEQQCDRHRADDEEGCKTRGEAEGEQYAAGEL